MMTTGCGEYHLPSYMEAAGRRCDDEMQDFLKRVNSDGVPVDRLSVAGYCPAAIHEAAAKERADLIIISTHGRSGLGRAVMGSVAEATVRNSPCPVLVVPSTLAICDQLTNTPAGVRLPSDATYATSSQQR
jgi:nucleotide-binding universal stress UspA family protein